MSPITSGRTAGRGVVVAVWAGGGRAPGAADVADHLGADGGAHVALDALDGLFARGDVDAGRGVGQRFGGCVAAGVRHAGVILPARAWKAPPTPRWGTCR